MQRAVDALGEVVRLDAASAVYETEPMYVQDQPAYLNAAVAGDTDLPPRALLAKLKRIEANVGRLERARYGPREIDVDLVLYGALAYRFIDRGIVALQIPHAHLSERRFVLQPLIDVWPDAHVPGMGPASALLAKTEANVDTVLKANHAVLSLHRN